MLSLLQTAASKLWPQIVPPSKSTKSEPVWKTTQYLMHVLVLIQHLI